MRKFFKHYSCYILRCLLLMSAGNATGQGGDKLDYSSSGKITSIQLGFTDIAEVNLSCGTDLTEKEIPSNLKVLDKWADAIKASELKYKGQYTRNPQRYENSYAKFRVINLVLTLKEELGCDYNMNLVKSGQMSNIRSNSFYSNPKDVFIHGLLQDKKGTCCSFPVLVVALGRRCGMPLKLVTSKAHMFCRWEDDKERFNIETACPGVDIKPDEHYRNWPYKVSDAEIKNEKYLKSLTAEEEQGTFMRIRAACLYQQKRYKEAIEAYESALKAFPDSTQIKAYIAHIRNLK